MHICVATVYHVHAVDVDANRWPCQSVSQSVTCTVLPQRPVANRNQIPPGSRHDSDSGPGLVYTAVP